MDPTLELNRFVGPFIILGIGLMFIFKPHRSHWRRWDRHNRRNWRNDLAVNTSPSGMASEEDPIDRRDFLDVTAVFGGVKKNVLSKNFKGGDIVSFMNLRNERFSMVELTSPRRTLKGGSRLTRPIYLEEPN